MDQDAGQMFLRSADAAFEFDALAGPQHSLRGTEATLALSQAYWEALSVLSTAAAAAQRGRTL
jgi:hypothetical protein